MGPSVPSPDAGHFGDPWRLSKSTTNSPPLKSTAVILAVSGQLPTSAGLLRKIALRGSNGSTTNDATLLKLLVSEFAESLARTRQYSVADGRSNRGGQNVWASDCSCTVALAI